ncbi:MAG: histidine phosphatase family protein [Candidatus Pacebacteria bacterium]|nr:histidine phosphatase family protein [Candidatus Paceibacterota bacterium]
METELKNRYFFVRHGQNVHQAEHPGIIYLWPDGNPPYALSELGKEQTEIAGNELKKEKIDIIFSSDIFRCRETAKIIADIIGYDREKIIYDTRLRDLNWGDFGGKTKEEYLNYYDNDKINAFDKPAPNGESWNQCKERMVNVFNEINERFENKNIVIVSHGDPMWLLIGHIKDIKNEELLRRRSEIMPSTGEVREIK